jgi:hypothetical protein
MSRNEDIWAERGQRAADKWTDHPIRQSLKWLAIILVGIFVLGFVSNTLGFVSLWGNEVKRVVSPDNVRTQFGVLYDNYEALESIAGNVCAAQDVQTNNQSSLMQLSIVELKHSIMLAHAISSKERLWDRLIYLRQRLH